MRAESVSQVFTGQGVSPSRIRLEGRGESEPRASNETEAGRLLNRRVAIYVKPIIEGKDELAYESPRY
jgi:outer membrane protein OmpA-like peptidoglycan-associated protein